jgi:hypothetical protein
MRASEARIRPEKRPDRIDCECASKNWSENGKIQFHDRRIASLHKLENNVLLQKVFDFAVC